MSFTSDYQYCKTAFYYTSLTKLHLGAAFTVLSLTYKEDIFPEGTLFSDLLSSITFRQ